MSIKCFFGFHDWEKVGGPLRTGSVEHKQNYRCKRCGDMKVVET